MVLEAAGVAVVGHVRVCVFALCLFCLAAWDLLNA